MIPRKIVFAISAMLAALFAVISVTTSDNRPATEEAGNRWS